VVEAAFLSRTALDTTPTITLPDFALHRSWNGLPARWLSFSWWHTRHIHRNGLRALVYGVWLHLGKRT
jgi:hypothetical protein